MGVQILKEVINQGINQETDQKINAENNEETYEENSQNALYTLIDRWLLDYRTASNEHQRQKARALIVTRMLPIIKRIARSIARRSYDPIEDLVQAGAIGLLKAINSFKPDEYNEFRPYAASMIIGEMKHFIRDQLNTIRVPAHIQELSTRINAFILTLTVEELNNLTNESVAKALNIPKSDVDFVQDVNRRKYIVSLESGFNKEGQVMSYEDLFAYEDSDKKMKLEDAKLIIQLVIARLPKEYRKYIELYYERDYNLREIADELCVSKTQVRRMLNEAFELLHEMIADSQLGNSLMELFE